MDDAAWRAEPPNVLHDIGGSATAWSTVNAAEAIPGRLSPLGWTFWRRQFELAVRQAFADIGALKQEEVRFPSSVEERIGGVFFGRFAGNVDTLRSFAERMPGASGTAFEEQFFGSARPGVTSGHRRLRYFLIVVKVLRAGVRSPAELARVRAAIDGWWRRTTETPIPARRAQATLAEAGQRFHDAVRAHIVATMLAQGMFEQVQRLAAAAGLPGHELVLTTGYGGLEETDVVKDLWLVSRDELSLEEFLRRHGYHGPLEGELSRPSWRQDSEALLPLVASYRKRDDSTSPWFVEEHQAAKRRAAEAELVRTVKVGRRPLVRIVLRLAARFIPGREVGKTAFLQAIDVARAAAWKLGSDLHDRGLLDRPEDVFFLTYDELTEELPAEIRDVVGRRRLDYERYGPLRLPEAWIGPAAPVAVVDSDSSETTALLRGIPVSGGVVEGSAKVVIDPGGIDSFEVGDVLVCEFTDPSWAPLLNLAGAVVIDVGGTMSHGAIVARELGIPTVINTRTGTKQLRTGDRVRVDADAGEVTVLERLAVAPLEEECE